MLVKWDAKWFVEFVVHLWCLLDAFWRLLMRSGEFFHVFGMNLVNRGGDPPVPMVSLIPGASGPAQLCFYR
jgi:hypothetical protein